MHATSVWLQSGSGRRPDCGVHIPMNLDSLQHVNVKVAAVDADGFDLKNAIPVFHRWIQEEILTDELAIDVADYRHVPEGPGVILVAHEAIYGLDQRGGYLGLLYDRRVAVEGTPQKRLLQAANAAFRACRMLEEDPELRGSLRFDGGRLEVSVNDRALAPNTDVTDQALRPEVGRLVELLWGAGDYSIEQIGEPRERYCLNARAGRNVPVAEILSRL